MRSDALEQLRALDPEVLANVVRLDQRTKSFQMLDWTVERLSTRGIINPDGLFCFSGHGRDEHMTRSWSVVLKVLRRNDECESIRDLRYWKRELLASQFKLLQKLPGPVTAPRLYAATENAGGAWLWMEHITSNTNQRWTLAQFAFAAYELGRFNGAYLTGRPLPNYAWLCRDHCRGWLTWMDQLNPERAWDNSFVRQAFSAAVRQGVEQLRAEIARFLAVLNQVPQVFSHFDFQRRNLFIRARDEATDEVVAVDWALVGIGALGGDLASLIGSSALLFEVEPGEVAELERLAVNAYCAGLRDVGWMGDPALIRLAYSAWLALWIGAAAPIFTSVWTSDEMREAAERQFGCGPEGIAITWAALCEFALDRADKARKLMGRLHFA